MEEATRRRREREEREGNERERRARPQNAMICLRLVFLFFVLECVRVRNEESFCSCRILERPAGKGGPGEMAALEEEERGGRREKRGVEVFLPSFIFSFFFFPPFDDRIHNLFELASPRLSLCLSRPFRHPQRSSRVLSRRPSRGKKQKEEASRFGSAERKDKKKTEQVFCDGWRRRQRRAPSER